MASLSNGHGWQYCVILSAAKDLARKHKLLTPVNRKSQFSYVCKACGRCCHHKVITLSPYDVLRLALAAGISTREAIARYTIRRGSILKFSDGGVCVALDGARCGVHRGRPIACRLYPLGI